jgi:hypothetical protein
MRLTVHFVLATIIGLAVFYSLSPHPNPKVPIFGALIEGTVGAWLIVRFYDRVPLKSYPGLIALAAVIGGSAFHILSQGDSPYVSPVGGAAFYGIAGAWVVVKVSDWVRGQIRHSSRGP